MKKVINLFKKDVRAWVLIIAAMTLFYSIERAGQIPAESRKMFEAVNGFPIEGLFSGLVFIGFMTLVVYCIKD